jgi:hypothetical protein
MHTHSGLLPNTPLVASDQFSDNENVRLSPKEWFVSQFAHCVMLLMMLMHSVSGSCWHHAHECSCGAQIPAGSMRDHHATSSSRGAGASHGKQHDGCCHQSSQVRPEGPHDSAPAPVHHTRCQDAPCVFLAAELMTVPPLLAGLPEHIADAGVHAICPQPVCVEQVRGGRKVSISAVSHCALYQVWRI